jgi:hypothetical protein
LLCRKPSERISKNPAAHQATTRKQNGIAKLHGDFVPTSAISTFLTENTVEEEALICLHRIT